jgi:hypothetical protein
MPENDAEDCDCDGLDALEAGGEDDDDEADYFAEPEVQKPLRVKQWKFAQREVELNENENIRITCLFFRDFLQKKVIMETKTNMDNKFNNF